MTPNRKKKVRRVVLGVGYFDTGDCRRRAILWSNPVTAISGYAFNKLYWQSQRIIGKKVRLIAEIIK